MNGWLIVAVLLLAGAVALAPTVWSWFDPTSPARAVERLLGVVSAWNGIRDLTAKVTVRGAEGETVARVMFLAPASFRLDVLAPQSLAGTVFALRPIADGWLFVHYRPTTRLGIEARLAPPDLEKYVGLPMPSQLVDGLRRGQIRVAYRPAAAGDAQARPRADEFDLFGLPGAFPRLTLRVDPANSLPLGVALYANPAQPPTVTIDLAATDQGWELFEVNTGLGLRDLFLLNPVPHRWLAPVPPPTKD